MILFLLILQNHDKTFDVQYACKTVLQKKKKNTGASN